MAVPLVVPQAEYGRLRAAFFEPLPAPAGTPPLTAFLLHVWRFNEPNANVDSAAERERFLFWFFTRLHSKRAPYQWPVPPCILGWLNAPAPTGGSFCLTRFMEHVRSEGRPDLHGIEFLDWFSFECMPSLNLPRALLTDETVTFLNKPALDESVPLTVAMTARLRKVRPEILATGLEDDLPRAIAASFLALPEILRSGDVRLIPEFVASFWLGAAAGAGELTRYEYTAARAYGPSALRVEAVSEWFDRHYLRRAPYGSLFARRASTAARETGVSFQSIRPRPRAIFVYRDHRTIAGLSRSGESTARALRLASAPVVELDFHLDRGHLAEEYSYNERQLSHAESGAHILNLNPEYVPECLLNHLGKVSKDDYIIGQFYWELSDTSVMHDCGLSLVNEIWVATNYLKEVYSRRASVPVILVGQHVETTPPDPAYTRASAGIPEGVYAFLVAFDGGSVIERKNPLAAARAFRQAFPKGSEPVALVLKTKNLCDLHGPRDAAHWSKTVELAAADPRIVIIDSALTGGEMAALHEICDCYVSLHRSEGFGYGPADAMSRGKPAIVTAYSGVTDFCNGETAFLVDFELVKADPGSYPFMDRDREYYWASPGIDSAARHMKTLFESPETGRRVAAAGQQAIAEQYSLKQLMARQTARLRELRLL